MKINSLMITGLILAVMACKTSTMVHAQPVAPPEFTVKVSPAELDLIGKGLGKLPFEESAPLIQKLRQQIVEQQKPVEKPAEQK